MYIDKIFRIYFLFFVSTLFVFWPWNFMLIGRFFVVIKWLWVAYELQILKSFEAFCYIGLHWSIDAFNTERLLLINRRIYDALCLKWLTQEKFYLLLLARSVELFLIFDARTDANDRAGEWTIELHFFFSCLRWDEAFLLIEQFFDALEGLTLKVNALSSERLRFSIFVTWHDTNEMASGRQMNE